jgi:hypothetical protein
MLTIQPKKRIVGRYIKTQTGEMVFAYFLVAEFGGKIFWKLVKVESCKKVVRFKLQDLSNKKETFCLPVSRSRSSLKLKTYNLKLVLSPFIFNTFFISQLTRAPSCK